MFRPYITTALLSVMTLYFAVNLMIGDRGLIIGGRREATFADRTRALEDMQRQTRDLQAQVRLLSEHGLSRDMLEERARLMLGYASPDDYVIRAAPSSVR